MCVIMPASKYLCSCHYFLILCTLGSRGSDDVCAFRAESYSVIDKERSNVTVHISVINTCKENNAVLLNIKVLQKNGKARPILICTIRYTGGMCSASPGCTCDNQSHKFSVTRRMKSLQTKQWKLEVQLLNNQIFQTTVEIDLDMPHDFTKSTVTHPPVDNTGTDNTFSSDEGATTTLTTDGAYRKYSQASAEGITSDIASSHREEKNGKGSTSLVVAVSVIGVVIVFIILLSVSYLRRIIQAFFKRSSESGSLAADQRCNIWRSQAEISNILYRGSNVSLMVSNDIYDGSCGASPVVPSLNACRQKILPLPSDACDEEVASSHSANASVPQRIPLPSDACGIEGATGGASPRWMDIGLRERMPLPPEACKIEKDKMASACSLSICEEEGDYADINSLRSESCENVVHDGMDVYTDIDDIRNAKGGFE